MCKVFTQEGRGEEECFHQCFYIFMISMLHCNTGTIMLRQILQFISQERIAFLTPLVQLETDDVTSINQSEFSI